MYKMNAAGREVTSEAVSTHDLREGDVIIAHGCVFRLRERKQWPMEKGFDPVTQGDCITFRTDLLYYQEHSMPRRWAETWIIQGNKLATWSRIVDWE